MLKKYFLILYSCYAWGLTGLVFIFHYLISNLICMFPIKNQYLVFYKIAIPFLRVAFFLGGIRVSVRGFENFPQDKNVIVVSNHQSLFDIVLILAYMPKHVCFFAKKELKNVPILNRGIEKMGHEYVDRQQTSKALQQLQIMAGKLKNNFNVLLFAEGTRSETGEILPFKRGAFYLAANTKKDIVPCYLHGTNSILRKSSKLFYPGKVSISLGKVIKISDQEHQDDEKKLSKILQKKGYDAVIELKNKLDLN
jgi:1-acyl-sn-glycerol-3-phosphate acyltransferase